MSFSNSFAFINLKIIAVYTNIINFILPNFRSWFEAGKNDGIKSNGYGGSWGIFANDSLWNHGMLWKRINIAPVILYS